MTATTTWPTQISLPGQAAAPAGPLDMWMMYVSHHAFRRDLARFASAAEHTPVSDRATWRRLGDRWQLLSLGLHHHHHGEDTGLWPLLEARVAPGDRAVLDAMEAEHGEIDPLLEAITTGLVAMAGSGDDDVRAALVVRLVAGRERLGAHLGHEETDAIAIMQKVMTEPEWLQVQEEHFKPKEITLTIIMNMIGWVVDGLPVDVRDRVLADMPGGTLVYRLTRPGYDRRERRAFRYATV